MQNETLYIWSSKTLTFTVCDKALQQVDGGQDSDVRLQILLQPLRRNS
jgi:hypothetical protein